MNAKEAIAGMVDALSRSEVRAHTDLVLKSAARYTDAEEDLIALAMVEAYSSLPENVIFS